jgi:cysteinyl-tRNA synthetase
MIQDPQDPNGRLMLHDTLTRKKLPFTAREGTQNTVAMYVCGVTAYDLSHIGHARVYVAFDVLVRVLQHVGFGVQYVRNFTDIDDKIIARAAQTGEDPLALSARYIEEFHADMERLGCLSPSVEPKATEHVQDMIDNIQDIISNGHGYAIDGDVFFDVQSLEGYGKLSRHVLEESKAGEWPWR